MRRLLAVLVVVAACGGGGTTSNAPEPTSGLERSANAYATSALRALEGTDFEVLDTRDLAGVVVGLCDGLGVGAIGVAAAALGIDAPEADVAILLEVLRTGLDQVCEEKVVVDLTAIYLDTIAAAVAEAGAEEAFDEIAAIRAAPVACDALDTGAGAEAALLAVVEVLHGTSAATLDDLVIGADEGLVAGAVLATATALLCPDRLDEIEALVGSL
jgi:hypothetical protein